MVKRFGHLHNLKTNNNHSYILDFQLKYRSINNTDTETLQKEQN